MQKLYTELKDKGMDLIAINSGDDKDTINKYIKENNWTFNIVMGGQPGGADYAIFKQYGVQAYPTNYVLDSNGKVVWRGIGFNEPEIRAALEKLGVK